MKVSCNKFKGEERSEKSKITTLTLLKKNTYNIA